MKNVSVFLILAVGLAACGSVDDPEIAATLDRDRQSDSNVAVEFQADTTDAQILEAPGTVTIGDAPDVELFSSAPDAQSPETLTYASRNTTSEQAEELEFMRLINEERASRGLAPLKAYWDLQDDAREHSKYMDQVDDLHHNPSLSEVASPDYWSRLGENVGVGAGVASLHRAFMNSEGHRDNVLGDFTHIGVGVHHPDRLWVTVVFMKASVEGLENTYGPFTDDDFGIHEAAIHKIWKAGLTYGCGGQSYCPDRTLSRGEMAAFLTRALSLPTERTNHFDDDDGAWYEASANAMYAAGVTYGCDDRRYCGTDDVTRGQMAAFLTRAFELPTNGPDHFDDDDGKYYEASANAMYEAGITHGCGGRNYCGDDSLTRAQMAAFLARALNL